MKWGVNTMILAYPTVTVEMAFELLREEGVRHVELGHPFFLGKIKGRAKMFKETLSSYGIEPIQMHGPNLDMSKFNEPKLAVKEVVTSLELASSLGVGALVVHSGMSNLNWDGFPTHVSKMREANIRAFKELVDKAEDLGLIVAVENRLERAYGSTPADLLDLLGEVGSDSLGVCLDTGHANVNGFPPHEFLTRVKGRLAATHIHDNDGRGDQHLPPLMGNIDWQSFFGNLKASGYPKPVIYEVAGVKSLREGRNRLRLLRYVSNKLMSEA